MEFQLVLQEIRKDIATRPQEITRILSLECALSAVEIGSILDQVPITIGSGRSSEKAEQLQAKLEAVGAKVLLVRTSSSPQHSSSQSLSEKNGSKQIFHSVFNNYKNRLIASLQDIDPDQIAVLAEAFIRARQRSQQIIILGNGGSAATASHMANDFLKHGHNDYRFSYGVISLTDNVPWLTAIANDFGYEYIFVQQLRNLLNPGDVVVALSSSGNSPNVLNGVEYANKHGAKTFGIVGFGGGKLSQLAQHIVNIPSQKGDYGVMEDGSLIVGHILSEFLGKVDEASAKK